jgi:hypothetical protein
MRHDEGYRDETASLVAENARLRSELARVRGPRRRAAAAAVLVVVDIVSALTLRPWFNGGSDAKFWAATVIVAVLTFGAVACALGAVPRRG